MAPIRRTLTTHPDIVYPSIALLLSVFALEASPPTIPLILLLGTVIVHATVVARRRNALASSTFMVVSLAVGSTLANLSASSTALSSGAAASLGISIVKGAVSSTVVLIIVTVRTSFLRYSSLTSPWLRLSLFPTIWACAWVLVSTASPVGRLGTWTPLAEGYYSWSRPFVGFAGVDFIVAAWAELGAAAFGQWVQGDDETDLDEPLVQLADDEEQEEAEAPNRWPNLLPAGFLLLLSIPSFFQNPLPLPAHSESTTPLAVSCVLPPPSLANSPKTDYSRYMAETKALAGRARVLLWPEGAVSFENHAVRENLIKTEVMNVTKGLGVWVGVSFEEPDPKVPAHSQRRRNGMVLVGPEGQIFEYWKRNLVPSKFISSIIVTEKLTTPHRFFSRRIVRYQPVSFSRPSSRGHRVEDI